MMYRTNNIRIKGISAFTPKEYIDSISDETDKKTQKLFKMTGINRRHSLNISHYKLVDLSIMAATDAIEKSGSHKEDIKAIVYVTQNPEFFAPSTAFYVQKELSLGRDCLVFDVNLGCSGFIAGLQILSSIFLGLKDGDLGLLINAEYLSRVKRENENDEFLFGDAATATILERNDTLAQTMMIDYFSDGNRYKAIFHEDKNLKCIMDGQAVFEFSVYEVSRYVRDFLKNNKLEDSDIDHIAFHQAQKFIIDHMATNAKLSKEKMLYSLDEYANTSGASVPLSICRNQDKLKEFGEYLLCGFGVGLAWGIVYLKIEKKAVFGIHEV